jgi:NAD(P)-dependent dehydrogenase (short-subunit alcohol dehydrogenase family)
VALVTGGRRGIGRGIVHSLAAAGFDVAIADLVCDADAKETMNGAQLRGARAVFLESDISTLEQHPALLSAVSEQLGPVSCLVNNAGISVASRGDMLQVTPDSFDRLFMVNLRGPFFLTQRVAAEFVASGPSSHYRSIINISSANAVAASINRAEYCLSKAPISMATKLFATRLGDTGVGVFEVRPGVMKTAMTAGVAADYETRIDDGLAPMRRWGSPNDVGSAVVALASGAFPFSTGDAINVDGGLHVLRF